MFDDDKPKDGQTPGNLPTDQQDDEPEDMFSGVDQDASGADGVSKDGKTAIDAGKLKKKTDNNDSSSKEDNKPDISESNQFETSKKQENNTKTAQSGSNIDTKPSQNQEVSGDISSVQSNSNLTEPVMNKGILTGIIVLVVLLVLGGGGWFVYANFMSQDSSETSPAATNENSTSTVDNNESENNNEQNENNNKEDNEQEQQNQNESDSSDSSNVDEQILFGDQKDTDEDMLSDEREEKIGTDPTNWDTDGDELGDGQEVLNWDTDPLNPDTDGDGYEDGAEIESGYSPLGEGKLFQPPTSTTSTSN